MPGWKLSGVVGIIHRDARILEHQAGFIGGIQNGAALLLVARCRSPLQA